MLKQVALPCFLRLPEVLNLVRVSHPSIAVSMQGAFRSRFRLVATRSSGLRRRSTSACQIESRRHDTSVGYDVRGRAFTRPAFFVHAWPGYLP